MEQVTSTQPLIKLSDKTFPYYLKDLKDAFPDVMFGEWIYPANLLDFGFAVIHTTARPLGDVVTEGEPELRTDKEYYQTWISRDYNETELSEQFENARSEALNLLNQYECALSKKSVPSSYEDLEGKTINFSVAKDVQLWNLLYNVACGTADRQKTLDVFDIDFKRYLVPVDGIAKIYMDISNVVVADYVKVNTVREDILTANRETGLPTIPSDE